MKPVFVLIAVLSLLLASCEQEPSREELLANKPTIYSMGVVIENIPLTHPNEFETRLFNEFGLPVDSNSSEGGRKNLAHPEFYNAVGTPVTAVSNGVVRDIFELGGATDILVMVTPDDAELWTIGYEHVSNVQVSVGDRVALGDYIADFSPNFSPDWDQAAKTALMIFYDNGKADEPNLTICPFDVIHADYKPSIQTALQAFMDSWETSKNQDIWDQESWVSFGCYTEFADG